MNPKIGTDEAEKIIKEYADMIYRIALHNLKNTADAEDIFQDVCIALITKNPPVDDKEYLKRWLIRVTINKCSSFHRLFWQKNTESMKKHLFTVCFIAVLTAFTLYITLDTFVISVPIDSNADKMNTSMFGTVNESNNSETEEDHENEEESESETSERQLVLVDDPEESSGTESSDTQNVQNSQTNLSEKGTLVGTYSNDNVNINLYECYEYETAIYVADVTVTSSQYIKTAFADNTYGKNVTATTSSIAQDNNAIFAINGDYYGARESGYVIRNGIVYRDTGSGEDLMCIYADGIMKIVNSGSKTADELVAEGVWQAFCFGPALIENSQITVSENDEVGKAMASNPRTALGMVDECHYVFVVSDGRTDSSKGLSLYQLAEFMQSIGAETAYNLDGGGSSTMYFNGQVINNPTTSGRSIKERGVSDIVYISK